MSCQGPPTDACVGCRTTLILCMALWELLAWELCITTGLLSLQVHWPTLALCTFHMGALLPLLLNGILVTSQFEPSLLADASLAPTVIRSETPGPPAGDRHEIGEFHALDHMGM